MEKIYSLLVAALLVSAPAFCANTAVQPQDFNTESVVSKLKSSDTDEMLAVPSAKFISHSYYTQSCARFTLAKSEDLETVTVLLTSREMIVEEIPDVHPPVTPPGGHKASADDKMQITHPGQIFTGQGKVTIAAPRTLLPWEQERFSVCMQGPNFALFRDAAAYNYTVKQKQGFFTLTPGAKVPTTPDPDGVRVVGVSVKQNKVFATMADKWAGYYTGEETVISAELYQSRTMWFDKKVDSAALKFKPADSYTLTLGQNLPPGKYYISWGFSRAGKISKPDFIGRGKTAVFEVK